jgi:hypothetical protein
MSLHSDTFFWFRANQSLLFLLNANFIVISLTRPVLEPTKNALEASTLTITPPIRFWEIYEWILRIYDWVYGSNIEGIYKNGGVFKLQRPHCKQYYLRLASVPPPQTHSKHPLSQPQSTFQWHHRSQFYLRLNYVSSTHHPPPPPPEKNYSHNNTTAIDDLLFFLHHKLRTNI